jgi:hypothetical protein
MSHGKLYLLSLEGGEKVRVSGSERKEWINIKTTISNHTENTTNEREWVSELDEKREIK